MAEAKQQTDFDESPFDVIYYATKTCPFSQRVQATLEAKGIKYKFVESKWKYDHSSGQRVITKEQWFQDIYVKAIGRNRASTGQSPVIKLVKEQKYYTESLQCCRLLDVAFKSAGASVLGLDDPDKLFRNEVFLGYITGAFGSTALKSKSKDAFEDVKKELQVLNAKMLEYGDDKVTDKFVFGESASLSDVCLVPYFSRIPGNAKFGQVDFNLDAYLKESCPRVSAWYEFIKTQPMYKNTRSSDDEWIGHIKEATGK